MTSPGDTRQVKIVVAADVAAAIRGLNQVSEAAGRVGGSGEQASSAWDKLKDSIAGQVALGGLIEKGVSGAFGAIADGAKRVIATGLDYEQSMNTLSAVTGASETEMKALGARAKELGNDITIPGASAGTAAAAMAELAKGGLTVEQSMTAASGTLRLAAAAQIDGAQAAEIQANALNAFRLKADQADHVADLLANAANAASGEITDMAAALKQSATVANGFGISVDDSATTLALFAKNGVLGSDAGTSFKTMLSALASPTDAQAAALAELNLEVYDASGNFVGMESVTRQLAAAHQTLTTEQYNAAASTAFGTDAIRAANILGAEGVAGWNSMAEAVTKAGGATELAAAQSQGLSGAMDRFNNAIDNAALTLFEKLSPALTSIADFGAVAFGWLGDVIGWMGELPAPVWAGVTAMGAMILLKGPLNGLFLQAIAGYTRMSLAVRAASFSFAGIAAAAKGAMAALGGPIGLAIIGVTTALSFMGSSTEEVTHQTADFSQAIDENTGALKANAPAVVAKALADSGSLDIAERAGVAIGDYTQAVLGNKDAQEQIRSAIEENAVSTLKQTGNYEKIKQQAHNAKMGTDEYIVSVLASGDASRGAENGLGDLINAYSALNADTSKMETQQRQTNQAIDGAEAAAGGAVPAMNELAGAQSEAAASAKEHAQKLQDAIDQAKLLAENTDLSRYLGAAKAAADDANRSMDYFRQLQDELTGHTRSYNDAVAAQNSNLMSLTKAFEAGTKAATENAEAGNLNIDALNEWDVATLTATSDGASMYDQLTRLADGHLGTANAAFQNALAQGKTLPDAMAVGRAEADKNRQAFIDIAAQYNGGNIPAAEALADKLGIVAGVTVEDKNFDVIAADQQAQDAIRNAQQAQIDDKTFSITAYLKVDQASLDAANAKAAAFGYAPTDYNAWRPHAEGGYISGPGGPTDDVIPAMLSNGEYVVNAKATDRWRGLLEQINAGRFARGGFVRLAAGGAADGSKAAPASGDGASESVSATVTAPDPSLFQDSWDQIVKSTQAAWDGGINPVLSDLSKANKQTGAEVTNLDQAVVAPAWENISSNVQGAWDQTILPTYTSLNSGTEQGGIWQNWLRDTVSAAWRSNQDSTAQSVGWTTGVTFPALNTGAQDVGYVQMGLAGTTTEAWTQIGNIIQITYDTKIVPAWTGVRNFTSEMGGFFTGIKDGINAATATAIGDIGKIKGAIQDFFSLVNAQVASAGFKDGGVIEGFATGGEITQGTGPRADDVLIRVSKGEYVVNAAATAAHRDTLDAINYGGMPKFANGGLIGSKIKQPTQDHITGGVHKAIEAGVSKALAAFPMGYGGTVIFNGNITVDGVTAPLPVGQRGEFIKAVASQMGTSYQWGGASPPLFDCSGLMSWGLAQAGRNVGRLTAEGFNSGFPHISPEKPGDLVTFDTGRLSAGQAGHIGMVFDPSRKIMLHTDGAGPARAGDYASRGGLLGYVDPIGGGVGYAPPGSTGGDPPSGGWLGQILQRIKMGGASASAGANYNPTAGVEQWRATVLQALGLTGQPASYADIVLHQMDTESSGNPRAINNYDINAQRGDPSRGLMQTIGSTFNAYRLPNLSADIYDPLSNIVAAIRYVLSRYGSIPAGMRGHAYDTGGVWPDGTYGWNTSGGPEMVLKPWQWAAAQSAIQQVTNMANRTYQGGQHGGIHIEKIENHTGSDLRRELALAAATARV